MCFRPAGIDAPEPVCPECNKTIPVMGGVVLKKCPFCKADISEYVEEYKSSLESPGAPAATGAPGAPGAAKAPGGPQAPKAPAPPRTPGGAQ